MKVEIIKKHDGFSLYQTQKDQRIFHPKFKKLICYLRSRFQNTFYPELWPNQCGYVFCTQESILKREIDEFIKRDFPF
jgi:hypothetical protein